MFKGQRIITTFTTSYQACVCALPPFDHEHRLCLYLLGILKKVYFVVNV